MKKGIGITAGILGVVLIIAGIILKVKKSMSISIIGGADGPTSIFLAGKVGGNLSTALLAASIVLLIIAIILLLKRKK